MGNKPLKKIKSFTLDPATINKLKKYADQYTNGNCSQAVVMLVKAGVPTTFEDYEHHAPEEHRNWKNSGKCNPRLKGFPCVPCWGMNATVKVEQTMNSDYEMVEVVSVENA
jgi:hypothetical protein